jgi:hypothetical protein
MFCRISKGFCGLILTAMLSIASFGQMPASPLSTVETPKAETKKAPCTLNQATLPRIAGLQMGASYDDLLWLYPEIANDKFFQDGLKTGGGFTSVMASGLFGETGNDKSVKVGLYVKDGFLVVISNDSGPKKYRSIRKAIADYSKHLGVDQDQWTILFKRETSAVLKCVDFAFYVNLTGYVEGETSMSVHSRK